MVTKPIILNEPLDNLLKDGAALVVSVSGGKDGQAMLNRLVVEHVQHGWTGPIYALHMHLGRAEWPQSLRHCQKIAYNAGVRLVIRHRPQGDLVQEIEDRMVKLAGTGKPFWPSSASRYCTSDQKRTQADKELRQFEVVVSAEGIRAAESDDRSKKHPIHIRKQITASAIRDTSIENAIKYRRPGQRLAINWYPIFDWSTEDVYQACGHSLAELEERRKLYREGQIVEALDGWYMHPAYVFGNDRLSCALCILGSINDLCVGGQHNPWLLNHYIRLEEIGGSTFKNGMSLKEIKRRIEAGETPAQETESKPVQCCFFDSI